MAANELLATVPGISISAASDEENESSEENNQEFEKENKIHSNDQLNNNLPDNNNYNGEHDEVDDGNGSKDDTSELSAKMKDIGIDDNEESSFKAADIVGDRVLVERDGKFELVDIAEVKAEYFEMKGIDEKLLNHQENDQQSVSSEGINKKKSENRKKSAKNEISVRPKTSPTRGNLSKPEKNNRVSSASITRRNNDEYSYIKSKYGMTEHQLEMKKKREEAIAKRKKEEEQRLKEEMQRKRDDAERAFQAWLKAKNEEYLEKRKLQSSTVSEDKAEKAQAAKEAYDGWLQEKAKQRKQEREVERIKLEEEAASFIIRERQACEEAFRRWLKQKRAEERRRKAANKLKKKKRRKAQKDQTLPINSTAIRFTDYYGYSHTVSL